MRNYTLFIFLFISLRTAAAPAGSALSGRITDTSGAPLAGAIIQIPDLHTGDAADATGHFRIANLPSGYFLITVKYLGYGTVSRNIKINGETDANFTLTETALEQHEVVVTGTSAATEQRRSPTPIQTINMKQMRENVHTNIIDAISRVPGVQQLSTGPAISKPVIRGLGYNRIVTLNDGLRQEGQQWGDEHGIEIDDYNVSRVEVLKGPASLAYGSDAIAGVINILSEEPAPRGRIIGTIGAGYQTNNGMGSLHTRLAGAEGDFYWSGYYTGKRAYDYQDAYDGPVFNTRFRNDDYGVTLGMSRHWGSSRLSFTSFNQLLGIAEGSRDSATGLFVKPVNNGGVEDVAIATESDGKNYSIAVPRQRIIHQKLAWENNLYMANGGRIGVTLGYQQNVRREFGNVLQPDVPGLHLDLRTFNYSAQYLFPQLSGWQISAGVNGMSQHNENRGIEFLVPDYSLFDIGGFVLARREWGPWSLSGGLRMDYRSLHSESLYLDSVGERVGGPVAGGFTRFAAFDKTFSSPSGSAGVSYALNKRTTFKVNFASGYRAPNIAELAANGVHEGTIRYEFGNQSLGAENSFQGDIGAGWRSEHLSMNAAVFYNYIRNFIFIRKLETATGADSIPSVHNPGDYTAFIYDRTNARLWGGELFVDYHPHPLDWLHFESTVSYVTGRTAQSGDSAKFLPYIPAPRWLVGLRAQKKKIGAYIGGAYAKLEADNYFSQPDAYTAFGTETPSPGYTLINASIGFDVLSKTQKMLASITIAGQNLGDIGYQNHLSRLRFADLNNTTGRQGIFGMGRTVSVQLLVPLALR